MVSVQFQAASPDVYSIPVYGAGAPFTHSPFPQEFGKPSPWEGAPGFGREGFGFPPFGPHGRHGFFGRGGHRGHGFRGGFTRPFDVHGFSHHDKASDPLAGMSHDTSGFCPRRGRAFGLGGFGRGEFPPNRFGLFQHMGPDAGFTMPGQDENDSMGEPNSQKMFSHKDMNQSFFSPATRAYGTPSEFVLQLWIPFTAAKDIQITYDQVKSVLRIDGHIPTPGSFKNPIGGHGESTGRRLCFETSEFKTMSIQPRKISASIRRNSLTIKIPKNMENNNEEEPIVKGSNDTEKEEIIVSVDEVDSETEDYSQNE